MAEPGTPAGHEQIIRVPGNQASVWNTIRALQFSGSLAAAVYVQGMVRHRDQVRVILVRESGPHILFRQNVISAGIQRDRLARRLAATK